MMATLREPFSRPSDVPVALKERSLNVALMLPRSSAVAFSGLILIAFGLLPIMGRIVACVPPSVLGGAGLVLFGTVAASGIRTLAKVDYHNNMNLIIVAASIGMGVLPMVKPDFYHHFPDWFATMFHSGISSTAVTVLLLNLVFNHF